MTSHREALGNIVDQQTVHSHQWFEKQEGSSRGIIQGGKVVLERAHHPCRGPVVGCQHTYDRPQLPVTAVTGDPVPSSGSHGLQYTGGTNKLTQAHTHHTQKLEINLQSWKTQMER